MDIEELVRKYYAAWDKQNITMTEALEAVLNEQAAWYKDLVTALNREVVKANKRIRQLEAERVPEGWIPVPFDPTPAMINAARWDEFQDEGDIRMTPVSDAVVAGLWAAMLAATQQKKEGET